MTRIAFYTLIFSSNHFRKKREREREKREPRSERERERKKRELAIDERRDRPTSAPLIDRDCERARRSRPSTIAIVDRAARRMIAPISPLISLLPRDLIFSSAARSQFDRIRLIFLLGFVSSVNECGIDSLSACLQLRKCVENWSYKAFSVKMFE